MNNPARQNVFIHPGFGKSGTTTIQRNIFGKHSQILSIGRPYSDLNNQIRREIGGIDGVNYDDARVTSLLDEALSNNDPSKHKCIVWSDEKLVSNAYMRSTVANRLKGFFPDSHVLFTIRNQITALESFYGNHGRLIKCAPEPHNGRFVSLDNWLAYSYQNKETTYLGLIDYFASISMYEKLFGEDRVHVFLFEELLNDKRHFSEKLSKLLSIDKDQTFTLLTQGTQRNPRDPGRTVSYARLRERVLPGVSMERMLPFGSTLKDRFSKFLAKGKGTKVEIPDNWKKPLNEFYGEGNSKLIKMKGLPLEEYGYPLFSSSSKESETDNS